jgi:hypothetical protein
VYIRRARMLVAWHVLCGWLRELRPVLSEYICLKEKVMHTEILHAVYMPMVAMLSVSLTGIIATAWVKKYLSV